MAATRRIRRVLELGTAVHDGVVAREQHVPRPQIEFQRHARLPGDAVEQLERLALRAGDTRHVVEPLRRVDVLGLEQDAQVAVVAGVDRQHLAAGAVRALAARVHPEILLEHDGKVGAATGDLVEDLYRAHQQAPPATGALAYAPEREDVASVGVQADLVIGLVVPDRVVGAELAAGVAHVVQQVAGEILTDRQPEVGTEAPESDAILGIAPPLDGKSSQEDEAPAPLQRLEHRLDVCAHRREWEVVAGDVEEIDAARRNRGYPGFEFRDHQFVEGDDPIEPLGHPIAAPRRRVFEGGGQEVAHGVVRVCPIGIMIWRKRYAFAGSGHLTWPILARGVPRVGGFRLGVCAVSIPRNRVALGIGPR